MRTSALASQLRLAALLIGIQLTVRGAVLFQEGFESGVLGPAWTQLNSNDGRCMVTTNFGPASGAWHLVLDDQVNDANYSTASASFAVDVRHKSNVVLQFKTKSLGNDYEWVPYGTYSGLPEFDGVSISTDGGATWRVIQPLNSASSDWESLTFYLDPYFWAGGGRRPETVLLRFSEYDNASAPVDGIAIDDVMVTGDEQQEVMVELPGSVLEGTGPYAGYVLLGFPATNTLRIALSASPTNQLSMPAFVDIPAGQTYAEFSFSALNDSLVNLARLVVVSPGLAGAYCEASGTTVLDDDMPSVTLTLPPQLKEGEHPETNAWVTLSRAPDVPMTLDLGTSIWDELSLPWQVTVPVGQTQVVFTVQAVDDNRLDGAVTVSVSANCAGMEPVSAQTITRDNEVASLSLLLPGTLREGASASGRIQVSGVLSSNLEVTLLLTNEAYLSMPSRVTVPSGWDSAEFTVTAPENTVREGSRVIYVSAVANGFTNASSFTKVLDDEPGTYVVSGLADIVDVGVPVQITVMAGDLEGNALPNFSGSVALELVSKEGVLQPLTPGNVTLSGETGWTGWVSLPSGVPGPFRVRARDGAGLSGDSSLFDVMRSCAGRFADLVWDARRNRFYATIPAGPDSTNSNQVVILEPGSAQITQRLSLAQDPGQMALTSGGEFLYVVLNANGTIARIDPGSLTQESVFPVGTSPVYGTLYASDISAVAGSPNLLVVAQSRNDYYPAYFGVAAYENGIPRPVTVTGSAGGSRIEPSALPNVFFALADTDVKKLLLDDSGITETQAGYSLLSGYDLDIRSDGDWVLSSAGTLVDGVGLTKTGRFPASGALCPNMSAKRVCFFEDFTWWDDPGYMALSAYDSSSFSRLVRLSLSRHANSPKSFIRWGTNGLAFLTDSNAVVLTSTRLVPSDPPADLVASMQASPDPASVSAPWLYAITVTNQGPNKAGGAFIKAILSEGQSLLGAACSRGLLTNSDNVVTLDCGDIASGDTVSLWLTNFANSAGNVSCTVVASSQAVDRNPADNAASASVRVGVQTSINSVASVRLKANNLVYDATRGLLWTSIPASGESPLRGAIVSLDPLTGLLAAPIALPADPVPACMCISENGRYLYAGLRGVAEVCRLDLSANPATVTRIQLGSDLGEPKDIECLEGEGTSFIVAGYDTMVFDGSVRRAIGAGMQALRIEKSGMPDVFIGYATYGNNTLDRMLVYPGGITNVQQSQMVLQGALEIRGGGNLVLSSSGRLVDAVTLTLTANFGISGAPCLDSLQHRAYIQNGAQLAAFDTLSLLPAGTFPLPAEIAYSPVLSCVRWGEDGFALNTENGLLYLGRWSAMNRTADANHDGMADEWELKHFGTVQVDPAGDEDRDGLCNALEYLFATPPTQVSPNPLLASVASSGGRPKLRIVFPRRAGLNPVPYVYETSADLVHWSAAEELTESVLGTGIADGVLVENLEVLVPATSSPAVFVRFRWNP